MSTVTETSHIYTSYAVRPKPSDLLIILRHASDALSAYADTARYHHARAVERGLDSLRGTRTLAGAASRADDLAGDLLLLIAGRQDITAADWSAWVKAAFAKVRRSRRTVLDAAEKDYFALGRNNQAVPEFKQLRELEHTPAMFTALSAVDTIGDAIRFTLSGDYDPTRARVIAAEEMASLYANLREWQQ